MTAQEKLDLIMHEIGKGKAVFIYTQTRATKVTSRSMQRFADLDRPLFVVRGESLFMSAGRRYDCIDYCGISSQDCSLRVQS